jgi:hypothetical protein
MSCTGVGVTPFKIASGSTNTWTIDTSQTVGSATAMTCTTPYATASMPNTNLLLANTNDGTFTAPKDGYIVRVEVLNSGTITAGTLNILPTIASSAAFTASISGTTLTATGTVAGNIEPGQTVTGTGVTANTKIVSGSGLIWTVDTSQTAASTAMASSLTTTVNVGLNPAITSGTSTYRVAAPYRDINVTGTNTSELSHFYAGDKIGVRIGTDSGFLPAGNGQAVTALITVMYQ